MNSNLLPTIHSRPVRYACIPFGPGQPEARVTSDGESLSLTVGLPDPWRPGPTVTLPVEFTRYLSDVLYAFCEG